MDIKFKKGKNIFIPGCKTEDDGTVVCDPKWVKGKINLESPRPIRLKKVDTDEGPVLEILDDGGAQTELIDKLRNYVQKRHL